MSGLRLIHPNHVYELIDGRLLLACPDSDPGGIAFVERDVETEYVLRASQSGDQPCTALLERRSRWDGLTCVLELLPTDFTLEDLIEVGPRHGPGGAP